jgi:hypothetical protein
MLNHRNDHSAGLSIYVAFSLEVNESCTIASPVYSGGHILLVISYRSHVLVFHKYHSEQFTRKGTYSSFRARVTVSKCELLNVQGNPYSAHHATNFPPITPVYFSKRRSLNPLVFAVDDPGVFLNKGRTNFPKI